MRKNGIDVSSWSGVIDWESTKDNVDFALLCAGFGMNVKRYDDQQFKRNAEACQKLHIPFGAYIQAFADNAAKAEYEAEHILRLVEGFKPQYPIYYCFDEKTLSTLSKEDILVISKAFEQKVSAAGYKVGFCASKKLMETKLVNTYYNMHSRWVVEHGQSFGHKGAFDIWQYEDGKDYCYTKFEQETASKKEEPKESEKPQSLNAKAKPKKKAETKE